MKAMEKPKPSFFMKKRRLWIWRRRDESPIGYHVLVMLLRSFMILDRVIRNRFKPGQQRGFGRIVENSELMCFQENFLREFFG